MNDFSLSDFIEKDTKNTKDKQDGINILSDKILNDKIEIKGTVNYEHIDAVTDWYVPEDKNHIRGAFVFPGTEYLMNREDLIPFAEKLLDEALKTYEAMNYKYDSSKVEVDNRRFRVQRIVHINGVIFAFRRIKDKVPNLNDLGVPNVVRQILLHPNLKKGGLIILVGETGQGKSTTCAAAIKERLNVFGSFALTLEDPPELPLHGKQGKGYCIQREVPSEEFAEALKGALRSYPTTNGNILYVGEIRDSKTAKEVMKAITSGHLVFSTIHGGSIQDGIERLVTYISGESMSSGEGKNDRDILAGALRLVVHQVLVENPLSKMYNNRNDDKDRMTKRLQMNILVSSGQSSTVANKISNVKDIKNLHDDIEMQQRILKTKPVEEFFETFMKDFRIDK